MTPARYASRYIGSWMSSGFTVHFGRTGIGSSWRGSNLPTGRAGRSTGRTRMARSFVVWRAIGVPNTLTGNAGLPATISDSASAPAMSSAPTMTTTRTGYAPRVAISACRAKCVGLGLGRFAQPAFNAVRVGRIVIDGHRRGLEPRIAGHDALDEVVRMAPADVVQ